MTLHVYLLLFMDFSDGFQNTLTIVKFTMESSNHDQRSQNQCNMRNDNEDLCSLLIVSTDKVILCI